MIVCLCNRVSDRDIERAVRSGTRCFEILQDDTRVASSCGCCLDSALEVFNAACGAHEHPAAGRDAVAAAALVPG